MPEADQSEIDSIDPNTLIKRLAPDQLGLFEPLSAMMLLNVEEEDLQSAAQRWVKQESTPEDVRLFTTINHETYHFAQTAASGYMFDRQRTTFRVLKECPPPPEPEIDPDFLKMIAETRAAVGDDPEANARLDIAVAMVEKRAEIDAMNAGAEAGDHSIAGALMPAFFRHLDERHDAEKAVNPQGLSILGVIEGSAVISAAALIHGTEAAAGPVNDELATLPPLYSELLAVTRIHAPDRAIEVALPAAAVALCYARPHDAYCAIAPMIASAPPGEALAHGRTLFESPPAIDSAGPWLGDALAQRDGDDSYTIYDPFHEPMRSKKWGIDTYDLLADPQAMNLVGSFPMGLATRTRFRGPFADRMDLIARLAISAAVLRVFSRRRAERDFQSLAAAWGHDVLHRLLD